MKVLALVSGGKDSTFSMMKCHEHGHEIVALANLYKIATEGNEDADSFCFQSVGQEIVPMIAECMELPLIRRETDMKAKVTSMAYEATEGDEVEDLYELVKEAKEKFPEIIPLPLVIGSLIEGALIIWPSKTIANLFPTLSVVVLPNF